MAHYLGIDSSTQSMTGLIIDTKSATMVAEESINIDEHYAEAVSYTHLTLPTNREV